MAEADWLSVGARVKFEAAGWNYGTVVSNTGGNIEVDWDWLKPVPESAIIPAGDD